MKALGYSPEEVRHAAAGKIQNMMRRAMGHMYLAREKVSWVWLKMRAGVPGAFGFAIASSHASSSLAVWVVGLSDCRIHQTRGNLVSVPPDRRMLIRSRVQQVFSREVPSYTFEAWRFETPWNPFIIGSKFPLSHHVTLKDKPHPFVRLGEQFDASGKESNETQCYKVMKMDTDFTQLLFRAAWRQRGARTTGHASKLGQWVSRGWKLRGAAEWAGRIAAPWYAC